MPVARFRPVEFRRKAETINPESGQPTPGAGVVVAKTSAYRRDSTGADFDEAGRRTDAVTAVFTVRRAGLLVEIDTEWEIVDDYGLVYDVEYARESRRPGRWWDVYGTRRS